MEIGYVKDKNERSEQNMNSKSYKNQRTEVFVPPTHPAYVVTSKFSMPHITALQDEFDKNFIAMSMQTSKKKLSKIPDTPTDKYFIVADDSTGPPILEGEFLLLNKKVVNYPIANNTKQVIEQFNNYIGLGHLEVAEDEVLNQYQQEQRRLARQLEIGYQKLQLKNGQSANYMSSTQQLSQGQQISQGQILGQKLMNGLSGFNSLKGVFQTGKGQSSAMKKSRIEMKEMSSRKAHLKVSEGKFVIYDNRKDSAEFKALVQKIKLQYGQSKEIVVLNRVDQYNNYCKNNKESENILLMTQTSYKNLSKYFNQYHSIAIFADGSQKMKYKNYENVALYSGDFQSILKFVQKFKNKKEQRLKTKNLCPNNQLSRLQQEPSNLQFDKQNSLEPIKLSADQPLKLGSPAVEVSKQPTKSILSSVPYISINETKPKLLTAKLPLKGGSADKEGYNPYGIPFVEVANQGAKKGKISLIKVSDFDSDQKSRLKAEKSADKDSKSHLLAKAPASSVQKSKISLIKISDLDKQKLKLLKQSKSEVAPNISYDPSKVSAAPADYYGLNAKSPQVSKEPLKVVGLGKKSEASKKSRLKKIKSVRKLSEKQIEDQQVNGHVNLPPNDQYCNCKSLNKQCSHQLRLKSVRHLRADSDQLQLNKSKANVPYAFARSISLKQAYEPLDLVEPPSSMQSVSEEEEDEHYVKNPVINGNTERQRRVSILKLAKAGNKQVKFVAENPIQTKKQQDNQHILLKSLNPLAAQLKLGSKNNLVLSKKQVQNDDNLLLMKKPEINKKENKAMISLKQIEQKKDNQQYGIAVRGPQLQSKNVMPQAEEEDNGVFVIKPQLKNQQNIKIGKEKQQQIKKNGSQQIFLMKNKPKLQIKVPQLNLKTQKPNQKQDSDEEEEVLFVKRPQIKNVNNKQNNKKAKLRQQNHQSEEGFFVVCSPNAQLQANKNKKKVTNQVKAKQDRLFDDLIFQKQPESKVAGRQSGPDKKMMKNERIPPIFYQVHSQVSEVSSFTGPSENQGVNHEFLGTKPQEKMNFGSNNDQNYSNLNVNPDEEHFLDVQVSSIHPKAKIEPNGKIENYPLKNNQSPQIDPRFSFGSLGLNHNQTKAANKRFSNENNRPNKQQAGIICLDPKIQSDVSLKRIQAERQRLAQGKPEMILPKSKKVPIGNKQPRQLKQSQPQPLPFNSYSPKKQEVLNGQQPLIQLKCKKRSINGKTPQKQAQKQREQMIQLKTKKPMMEAMFQKQVDKIFSKDKNAAVSDRIVDQDKQGPKLKQEDPYGLPLSKVRTASLSRSPVGTSRMTGSKRNLKIGKIYSPIHSNIRSRTPSEDSKFSKLSVESPRKWRLRSLNPSKIQVEIPQDRVLEEGDYRRNRFEEKQRQGNNVGGYSRSLSPFNPATLNLQGERRRSISDLMDPSKYDKYIENGVIIYRAKEPIYVSSNSSGGPFNLLPINSVHNQKFGGSPQKNPYYNLSGGTDSCLRNSGKSNQNYVPQIFRRSQSLPQYYNLPNSAGSQLSNNPPYVVTNPLSINPPSTGQSNYAARGLPNGNVASHNYSPPVLTNAVPPAMTKDTPPTTTYSAQPHKFGTPIQANAPVSYHLAHPPIYANPSNNPPQIYLNSADPHRPSQRSENENNHQNIIQYQMHLNDPKFSIFDPNQKYRNRSVSDLVSAGPSSPNGSKVIYKISSPLKIKIVEGKDNQQDPIVHKTFSYEISSPKLKENSNIKKPASQARDLPIGGLIDRSIYHEHSHNCNCASLNEPKYKPSYVPLPKVKCQSCNHQSGASNQHHHHNLSQTYRHDPVKYELVSSPKQNNKQESHTTQCNIDQDNSLTVINNLNLLDACLKQGDGSQHRHHHNCGDNTYQLKNVHHTQPSSCFKSKLNERQPLPEINEQRQDSQSEESQQNIDTMYQSIILYLIDKNKEPIYFHQINAIKQEKDSLMSFKNQKQLTQQLLQSENVYDLVYIIASQVSPQLKKILKNHQNCYIVNIGGQKTKITQNNINLPELRSLSGITEALISKMTVSRRKNQTCRSSIQPLYKSNSKTRCVSSMYRPVKYMQNCCSKHAQKNGCDNHSPKFKQCNCCKK